MLNSTATIDVLTKFCKDIFFKKNGICRFRTTIPQNPS